MSDGVDVTVILTDPGEVEQLRAQLTAITGEEPLVSDRRGIDGSAAGWLLLATTTVQALPAILDSIRGLITRNAVGEIEVDGVRMVKPRPGDIDRLLTERRQRPDE